METDETDQALLEMKRDIDAGTFVGDSWPEAVVTRSGRDPNNAEPNDITPAKSRRVIPTAVTLHPVWLEWTFGGDDDYKTAVPTMESIAKAVRKPDGKTSLFIDEVTGLVGTLHHEVSTLPRRRILFHLRVPNGGKEKVGESERKDSSLEEGAKKEKSKEANGSNLLLALPHSRFGSPFRH